MLTAFDNILRARDAFFKGLASLRPVTCIETTVGCKKKKSGVNFKQKPTLGQISKSGGAIPRLCMYSVNLRYFWKSVTTSENILEKILMQKKIHFFISKNRDDVEKSLLISLRAAISLEKTTIFSFVCWFWSRIWHIIHHRRTNKSLEKNAIGMMKKSKSISRFSLSIN